MPAVRGLQRYILEVAAARERVDLGQVRSKATRRRSRPRLLCDFFPVVEWLLLSSDAHLVSRGQLSPHSLLYGGDLRVYRQRIAEFVRALRHVGVTPIFFMEGAPGGDLEYFEQELPELYVQYQAQLKRCAAVHQVGEGTESLLEIPWQLPCETVSEILNCLFFEGVTVRHCTCGTTAEIIDYQRAHRSVLGVLSSNTDFAVAAGSKLFPLALFDLNDDLGVASTAISQTPNGIVCEWASPSTLCHSLQLANEANLIDTSILSGNRFTARLNHTCLPIQNLGLLQSSYEEIARWVTQLNPQQWERFIDDLCFDSAYCDAIARSYQLYGLPEGGRESKSPLHSLGQKHEGECEVLRVEMKVYDATLVAVRNGVYWKWPVLDSMTLATPCFSDLTLPLRKAAYTLLGAQSVCEYGCTSQKTFDKVIVRAGLASDLNLSEMSNVECCVALFVLLTQPASADRLETLQNKVAELVDELDNDLLPDLPSTVLACGTLCFMQHLTAHSGYQLQPKELECLLMTCLFCSASVSPLAIPEKPLSASVKVAMHFSHLLDQTRFLASVLGISGSLPPPSAIFYPMAFFPHSLGLAAMGELSSNLRKAYHNSQLVLHKPPVPELLQEISGNWQHPRLSFLLRLFSEARVCVENLNTFLFHGSSLPPPPPALQFIFSDQLQQMKADDSGFFENTMTDAVEVTDEESESDLCSSVVSDAQLFLEEIEEGEVARDDAAAAGGQEEESGAESLSDCMLHSLFKSQSQPLSGTVSEDEEIVEESPSPVPSFTSSSSFSSSSSECSTEFKPTVPASLPKRRQFVSLPRRRQFVSLPIAAHQEQLMGMIEENRVVCVEGETGCGKSTRVPQFILDHALSQTPPLHCRVLVTQPRRMAAVKLAERVANERGERVGVSVGYCVGGERVSLSRTAITYCTTGYLLQVRTLSLTHTHTHTAHFCSTSHTELSLSLFLPQALIHNPELVTKYTHIVLDEIHERSTEADFTLLVIRELLQSHGPAVKLVIMSATMQGSLLVKYLQETFESVAGPYFVGVNHYGVDTFFLDEVDKIPPNKCFWDERQLEAAANLRSLCENRPPEMNLSAQPLITSYTQEVCTEVVISQAHAGESILVFLPGYNEIVQYYQHLQVTLEARRIARHFCVFVLHSRVSLEDQKKAFCDPPSSVTHVILATNIAESSVTLPKLRIVINFGIYRRLKYDSKRHISCLVKAWCSRASCEQRAGRAGRVFVGTVVHLFTRQFHDLVLPAYDPPEMLTAPIAKLVLQAKQIGKEVGHPRPSLFLGLALTPPHLEQLEAALQDLSQLGAIESQPGKPVDEESDITFLGRFSLSLPVDLDLCRIVLFGVLFGCPLEGVVVAASISLSQEVFKLPTRVLMKDEGSFLNALTNSCKSRYAMDGGAYSDAVMTCNLFKKWLAFREKRGASRHTLARRFSRENACQWERLLQFEVVVGEIAQKTTRHLPPDCTAHRQLCRLALMTTLHHPFSSTSPEPSPLVTDLEFCSDVDVVRAMLAASYSHQLLFGVQRCDSLNDREKAESQSALEVMRNCGVDVARTVFLSGGKKCTKPAVHQLAEAVLPNNFFQVNSFGGMFLLTLNHSFDTNPLTSLLHNLNITPQQTSPHSSNSEIVSSSVPHELALFWQFGERRPQWTAGDIDIAFTQPQHPLSVSWFRVTEERERVRMLCWRNPTGLICEVDPLRDSLPFLAVACYLQGFGGSRVVSGNHITVLPSLHNGRNTLLLALAFQPLTAAVRALVDHEQNLVVRLSINSFTLPPLPSGLFLDPVDVDNMNSLREAISQAFTSRSTHFSLQDLLEVPCCLSKLLGHGQEPQKVMEDQEKGLEREWENLLGSKQETLVSEKSEGEEVEELGGERECGYGNYKYLPGFQCSVLNHLPEASAAASCGTARSIPDSHSLNETQRVFKLSPNAPEFVPSQHQEASSAVGSSESVTAHHTTKQPVALLPLPTFPTVSGILTVLSQLPSDQQRIIWQHIAPSGHLLPRTPSGHLNVTGSLYQSGVAAPPRQPLHRRRRHASEVLAVDRGKEAGLLEPVVTALPAHNTRPQISRNQSLLPPTTQPSSLRPLLSSPQEYLQKKLQFPYPYTARSSAQLPSLLPSSHRATVPPLASGSQLPSLRSVSSGPQSPHKYHRTHMRSHPPPSPVPVQVASSARQPFLSKLDLFSRAPGAQLSSIGSHYQARFPSQPSLPRVSLSFPGFGAHQLRAQTPTFHYSSRLPASSAQFIPEAFPATQKQEVGSITPSQYATICDSLRNYLIAELRAQGPSGSAHSLLKSYLQSFGFSWSLGKMLVNDLTNICRGQLILSLANGDVIISLPPQERNDTEIEGLTTEGVSTETEIEGVTTETEIEGVTTGTEIEGVTTETEIEGVTTETEIEGVTTESSAAASGSDHLPSPEREVRRNERGGGGGQEDRGETATSCEISNPSSDVGDEEDRTEDFGVPENGEEESDSVSSTLDHDKPETEEPPIDDAVVASEYCRPSSDGGEAEVVTRERGVEQETTQEDTTAQETTNTQPEIVNVALKEEEGECKSESQSTDLTAVDDGGSENDVGEGLGGLSSEFCEADKVCKSLTQLADLTVMGEEDSKDVTEGLGAPSNMLGEAGDPYMDYVTVASDDGPLSCDRGEEVVADITRERGVKQETTREYTTSHQETTDTQHETVNTTEEEEEVWKSTDLTVVGGGGSENVAEDLSGLAHEFCEEEEKVIKSETQSADLTLVEGGSEDFAEDVGVSSNVLDKAGEPLVDDVMVASIDGPPSSADRGEEQVVTDITRERGVERETTQEDTTAQETTNTQPETVNVALTEEEEGEWKPETQPADMTAGGSENVTEGLGVSSNTLRKTEEGRLAVSLSSLDNTPEPETPLQESKAGAQLVELSSVGGLSASVSGWERRRALTERQVGFFVACLQLVGGHSHVPKLASLYRLAHKSDLSAFFYNRHFESWPEVMSVAGHDCVILKSGVDLAKAGIVPVKLQQGTEKKARELADYCVDKKNYGGSVSPYPYRFQRSVASRNEPPVRESSQEREKLNKPSSPLPPRRESSRSAWFSRRSRRSFTPLHFPQQVKSPSKPGHICHILKFYNNFFATRTEPVLYADLLQEYVSSTHLPSDFYLPSEKLRDHFEVYREENKRYIRPLPAEVKSSSTLESKRSEREMAGEEAKKQGPTQMREGRKKRSSVRQKTEQTEKSESPVSTSASGIKSGSELESTTGLQGKRSSKTARKRPGKPSDFPIQPGHPDHIVRYYSSLFANYKHPLPLHGFSVRYLRAYNMPRGYKISHELISQHFRIFCFPRSRDKFVCPVSWREGWPEYGSRSTAVAPVRVDTPPQTEVWGEECGAGLNTTTSGDGVSEPGDVVTEGGGDGERDVGGLQLTVEEGGMCEESGAGDETKVTSEIESVGGGRAEVMSSDGDCDSVPDQEVKGPLPEEELLGPTESSQLQEECSVHKGTVQE